MHHLYPCPLGHLHPLLRIVPAPTIAPVNAINYSFTPTSALHLSAMLSMPGGAVLGTVEPDAVDERRSLSPRPTVESHRDVLAADFGWRTNAFGTVSIAAFG